MRRLKALLLAAALVLSLTSLAAARDHDDRDGDHHDRGRHNGWYNHNNNNNGYHTDNGRHNGWYKNHDRDDDDDNNRGAYRNRNYGYYGNGQYNRYPNSYPSGSYYPYGGYGNYYPYGNNGCSGDCDADDQPYGGGYGGYYPNGGYGNGNAAQWGYRDGLQAGQRDRASGHSYRPTQWEAYRDADHGMSSSGGYYNSNQYKQQYRQAFMQGYQRGYGSGYGYNNGGRYYPNGTYQNRYPNGTNGGWRR